LGNRCENPEAVGPPGHYPLVKCFNDKTGTEKFRKMTNHRREGIYHHALPNPNSEVGTGKLEEGLDRQRVGKATPGKVCTRWLQARRARSDAPYRAGRAAGPFDFIAHFGIRA